MKESFNNIKFTWKYVKKKKFDLFKYILVNILTSIICIILPIVSAELIVKLTNNHLEQLFMFAAFVFLLNTIWDFMNLLAKYYQNRIYISAYTDLQDELGNKFLKIKNKNIDKNGTGLFIERFTSDVEQLSDIFNVINWYLSTAVMYIGIFIAIFITSKYVFLYLILTVILLNLIEHKRASVRNKYDEKYRIKREESQTVIGEMVKGSKDIKMLNSEQSFLEYFHRTIFDVNKTKYLSETVQAKYNFGKSFVSNLLDLLLIVLLIVLIKNNLITLVSAFVLYNYSKQTPYSTQFVGQLLDELNRFNLSANRLKTILNEDKEFEKEKFGNKQLDKVKGNFEFKNVSFGYGKKKLFNDLSFKINANETLAFVGKSGAGKTTIFNLLCKMYDIDNGEITIDGININELDKETIRGNITIINQSPYIFNLSIKDNLKLVKKDVTLKEIKEACKIACLDEYINSLPDKYDTIVGEGGVNLSGGQKQRLAIARALIQKTKIILFDEATSALDNETQSEIQTAINNMKGDYTILIIAHRLSTIIDSDRILFLDNGKIEAEGTHKELLKTSEGYKKLYEAELKNKKR